MKSTPAMHASLLLLLSCSACARIYYEDVRTPLSSHKKQKQLRFRIDSQPQGAGTYIDGIVVGQTPVTVETKQQCKEVTYRYDKTVKTRRTAADITAGAILLAGSILVGLCTIIPSVDEPGEYAGVGMASTGLGVPGLALLIRGIVLKSKHGKVVSSKETPVEECPPRSWKLVLTKENYLPAERVLKPIDAGKANFVALTPAIITSSGAPPPAALDKTALLSSMASKTSSLTAEEQDVGKNAKKLVQGRMENLQDHVSVGEGYEAAGDDIFLAMEKSGVKMFEMTTEKDYCYIISAVAEPGNSVYTAVFRGEQEITKNFEGKDISTVKFCSDSDEPVRVTTSTQNMTTVGLRIYYLAP